MKMTRRSFLACSISSCALLVGGLAGCGNGSSGGSGSSKADNEPTKTVTCDVADGVSVSVEVPDSWNYSEDKNAGYISIVPGDFNGMVMLGVNISPMSQFTDDQSVLDYWDSKDPSLSGDWNQVDDGVSPVYETTSALSGDNDGKGIVRVAICGDYAIACECYAAGKDWDNGAEDELRTVMSTYTVSDPVAPNYPPKDVFTIVSATHAKDLGYGYWEMHVTVQNNSDSAKNFLGFQIDELDADGNIIKSYMSYNKNAAYAVVEPGQTYTIPLTEAVADGIAGMQSRYCEWGDSPSSATKSEYSEFFKTMF
jgi:hypothetical protein